MCVTIVASVTKLMIVTVIYILHVCMGMVLFYFVSKAYSIVDRPDSYIIDSYPIHV